MVAQSEDYYSRPIKGSWEVEGGGALINQAVHQVDVLPDLIGGVREVFGYWQLGALHKIESEDVVTPCSATRTAPPASSRHPPPSGPATRERIEIHGTKGTAIFTGDKLTTWDVDR